VQVTPPVRMKFLYLRTSRISSSGVSSYWVLPFKSQVSGLWQNWQTLAPAIDAELQKSDYRAALEQLATLGAPLDAFFTDVMVMSDDPALQQNRLALLTTLQRGFDQIADLSLLSE